MRIAWCTPFAVRSAIGRVSALAVTALRGLEGVEVDVLWPRGAGGRTAPDRGAPLPADASGLDGYDHVVYNVGDHPGYHRDIVHLSRTRPGLVVLHDVSLVHLFYGELLGRGDEVFAAHLERWFGERGRRAAAEAAEHRAEWPWRPQTVVDFPLVELALEGATAVLTHSSWAAERLRRRYLGDVFVAPLPTEPPGPPAGPVEVPGLLPEGPVVLQAGVLNPNKHVDLVLAAFADSGLAGAGGQLVVCGHSRSEDLVALRAAARRFGVEESVLLLGEVPDATLDALRRRADVATVLRHPCGEAASAVLLDSLAHGLPVVSVDDGCYGEVPREVGVFVDTPPTLDAVAGALRTLVADPERRARAGQVARAWVDAEASPARYASAVVEALEESGAAGRRAAVASAVASLTDAVGAGPDDPVVARLVERAHELFARAPAVLGPGSGDAGTTTGTGRPAPSG